MTGYVVFPDQLLSEIRERIDLVELISRDVALRKGGKTFVACCPFHAEKTPSFHVDPARGSYRCYGCQARGDAITWLRERHHLSFHEAVRQLASHAGIQLPESEAEDDAESRKRRRALAGAYGALSEANRAYIRALSRNEAALDYLTNTRSLTAQTIQEFELGLVGSGVISFLVKRFTAGTFLYAGIGRESDSGGLIDRFRHRLMIPIRNQSGTLIGFAGRTWQAAPGDTPKYINSPETELFRKGRELFGLHLAKTDIRRDAVAIVVEGYFDVLTLHQSGERRAVGTMGTAFTDSQCRRLLSFCDTIIFAFDGDSAGQAAALKAALTLLPEIKGTKTARFILLPVGSDPDSYVRENGLTAWNKCVADAMPLSEFLTEYTCAELDSASPETRVVAAERARQVLEKVTGSPYLRRALCAHFEERIGISLE